MIYIDEANGNLVQIKGNRSSLTKSNGTGMSATGAKTRSHSNLLYRMNWELSLSEAKSPSKKQMVHTMKSKNEFVQIMQHS